jgi:hypothetical protein
MKTLCWAISMVLKKLPVLPIGRILSLCLLGGLSISGAHSQQRTQAGVPPKIDARFSNGFEREKVSADLWLKELENTMVFIEKEDLSPSNIDRTFGTKLSGGNSRLVMHPLGSPVKVRLSGANLRLPSPYLANCKRQRTISSLPTPNMVYYKNEATFPLLAPSFDGTVRLINSGANSFSPTFLVLPLDYDQYEASVDKLPFGRVFFHSGDEDSNFAGNRLEAIQTLAVRRRDKLDGILLGKENWSLLPNQTGQLLLNKFKVVSLLPSTPKTNVDQNQTTSKPIVDGPDRLVDDANYKHYEIVYQGKKGIWRIFEVEAIAERTSLEGRGDPIFRRRCVERVIAFHPKPSISKAGPDHLPLEDALIRLLEVAKPIVTTKKLGGKAGFKLIETLPINGASGIIQFAISHPGLAPNSKAGSGPSTLLVHSPCLSSWNKRRLGTQWYKLSAALRMRNCTAAQRITAVLVPNDTDVNQCVKESTFIEKLSANKRLKFKRGLNELGFLLKHRFGTALIIQGGVKYVNESVVSNPITFSKQEDSRVYKNVEERDRTWNFISQIGTSYSKIQSVAYFKNNCLVRLDHHGEFVSPPHQN